MTASRLILAIGILLIVGFIWSLRTPTPGIHGEATVPVEDDELWRLNH